MSRLVEEVKAAEVAAKDAAEALDRAEAAAQAAEARLVEERATAAEVEKRKAAADPFAEKAFVALLRESEVSAAKVAVLERRLTEAQDQVGPARQAAEAADLELNRRRFALAEAELNESSRSIGAALRNLQAQFVEALRPHAARLAEAKRLRALAFEDEWRMPSIADRWTDACAELDRHPELPLLGVLGAAAGALDAADREAWQAAQPPRPVPMDPNAAAEQRRGMALAIEALERLAEEEAAKQRRAEWRDALSAEELDQIQVEQAKAAAIAAKVERDNPESDAKFTGDFQPRIG